MCSDIDSLNYLSATGAIENFRTVELSLVELLDAVIERASQISDSVYPFADKTIDSQACLLDRFRNLQKLDGREHFEFPCGCHIDHVGELINGQDR